VSCDEVTTVDNGFWICIHAYVVQSWVRIPILLQVECVVDGLGNKNLIEVIIVILIRCRGLIKEDVSKTLLCFGVNGAFFFKGEICVTRQIRNVWAPISMGVHWVQMR
jgi:hypothetical protein